MLNCLLGLNQPSKALIYASGLLAQKSDWLREINEYQIEAAWRLSSWDSLQDFLEAQESIPFNTVMNNWSSWSVATGRVLLSAHNLDKTAFVESLSQARSHQTSPLAAAAMEQEAYQRGYHYVLRLHILTEVEKGFGVLLNLDSIADGDKRQAAVTSLLDIWKTRKSLVQVSHFVPMLHLYHLCTWPFAPRFKCSFFLSEPGLWNVDSHSITVQFQGMQICTNIISFNTSV